MALRPLIKATLLIVLACGSACSNSHELDRDAAVDNAVSEDAVRRAYCAYLQRCDVDRLLQEGGSVEACVDAQACDPRFVVREDEREACLQGLKVASCQTNPSVLASSIYATSCERILHPNAQEGESCADAQCAKGLYCAQGDLLSCPVCRPLIEAGESCPKEVWGCSWLCAEGAFEDAGRCVAQADAGEPCSQPNSCWQSACDLDQGVCVASTMPAPECARASDCADGEACIGGTCLALTSPVIGKACQGDTTRCPWPLTCRDGQCAFPLCEPAQRGGSCGRGCASGLRCDVKTDTCLPQKAPGEPCNGSGALVGLGSSAPDCRDGSFCHPIEQVCIALAGQGASCDASVGGAGCEAGLFCAAEGKCIPVYADGESCSAAWQCASGRCFDGQCGIVACTNRKGLTDSKAP